MCVHLFHFVLKHLQRFRVQGPVVGHCLKDTKALVSSIAKQQQTSTDHTSQVIKQDK